LFAAGGDLPQFAPQAYTVAAVLELAPAGAGYEFQRCMMGEALYEAARAKFPLCRRSGCTAGGHSRGVLPYLVRRLLENGAQAPSSISS